MKRKILSLLILVLLISCEESTEPDNNNGQYHIDEQEILNEVNLVRSNPDYYASLLEETVQYYEGNLYREPGKTALMTEEGVEAVLEAIDVLKAQKPLNILIMKDGLSKAARDHVEDTGPNGILGHIGSDGSKFNERIDRYGTWDNYAGENITYGPSTARDVVKSFIIDDGVASRGHRENILRENYKYIGIATGYHSVYNYMTVMVFADYYTEKTL